jgi:hypothetical protein
MLLDTEGQSVTSRKFNTLLNGYLQDSGSAIVKPAYTNGATTKRRSAIKLGDVVRIPETDITHVYNNEAMLAISHAIEDLASETRQGELISTFQELANFQPQKKRYQGLAKDLDAVRVWGNGAIPSGCPGVDFIPIFRPELLRYWMVLFASPDTHAVLLCRQINDSKDFRKKVFAGFYSFNPFLVESVKRHFNLMSVGLDKLIRQWEKDLAIPTISLSAINKLFKTATEQNADTPA